MTDSIERPACPHCDTIDLSPRNPGSGGNPSEAAYYCSTCNTPVDDPRWREPYQAGKRSNTGTVARRLEDADPSDLHPTDDETDRDNGEVSA